jgi:hypothetical protein
MARALIVIGLMIAAVGVLWPLGRLGLGHLPGDFVPRHGNFTYYAPVATCLVISVAPSLILWMLSR